jgi:hypothetical protein
MPESRTKIERRLAAILTVDTVDYSRMMEADEVRLRFLDGLRAAGVPE